MLPEQCLLLSSFHDAQPDFVVVVVVVVLVVILQAPDIQTPFCPFLVQKAPLLREYPPNNTNVLVSTHLSESEGPHCALHGFLLEAPQNRFRCTKPRPMLLYALQCTESHIPALQYPWVTASILHVTEVGANVPSSKQHCASKAVATARPVCASAASGVHCLPGAKTQLSQYRHDVDPSLHSHSSSAATIPSPQLGVMAVI